MITLSCNKAKSAIDYILNDVSGRDDNSNLKSALLGKGIQDIFDLSTIDDEIIDDLEYEDKLPVETLFHATMGKILRVSLLMRLNWDTNDLMVITKR
jgi:hypothetical protein